MKKIAFIIFLFLFKFSYAQQGFYDETTLNFASNFLQNSKAMHQLGGSFTFGYEFSSHFRAGLVFPVGYTSFKDENLIKYRGFSAGFGINLNAKLYSNEKITLRADLKITGHDLKNKGKEWTIISFNPNLQCYFDTLATENFKPFVALGLGSFYTTDGQELQSKEYFYNTPSIFLGFIHKL